MIEQFNVPVVSYVLSTLCFTTRALGDPSGEAYCRPTRTTSISLRCELRYALPWLFMNSRTIVLVMV